MSPSRIRPRRCRPAGAAAERSWSARCPPLERGRASASGPDGVEGVRRGDRMPVTPPLGFEPSPLLFSRRLLIAGIAGGMAGQAFAQAEPLIRRGTPQLTLGPFYPLDRPSEEDADLTRIA